MFKCFFFVVLFVVLYVFVMLNGDYLLVIFVFDMENVILWYIYLSIVDVYFDVSYVLLIYFDLIVCKLQNYCEGVWLGLSVVYININDCLSIGVI